MVRGRENEVIIVLGASIVYKDTFSVLCENCVVSHCDLIGKLIGCSYSWVKNDLC